MGVRAGIVVTGTEVLTGRVSDRNGPWVSERLGELGIEVSHITCVGDRPGDLASALRFLEGDGVDLIVTTGGLGPTADDLTAAVVGEFAGAEMELDTAMEAKIARIVAEFARRFRLDPEGVREGTRKQAMVPVGGVPIDPQGTAPGIAMAIRDLVAIVLPGPPRELQGMWPRALATTPVEHLLTRAEPYLSESIRMFNLAESTLAKTLREIEQRVDLTAIEVTTCLRGGSELEIDLRFRASETAQAAALVDGLRDAHAKHIYSDAGESIDQVVAEGLLGAAATIAVAESCTGGLLAARLTNRPGSSRYFHGGVVAYSNAAKQSLLGVPAELIAAHGAVSPQVAEAMADGAIKRFGTTIGVGLTGVAGPDGGSEGKPIGYVCLCAKDSAGRVVARDPEIPGARNDIRDRSVAAALHLVRRLLADDGTAAPF